MRLLPAFLLVISGPATGNAGTPISDTRDGEINCQNFYQDEVFARIRCAINIRIVLSEFEGIPYTDHPDYEKLCFWRPGTQISLAGPRGIDVSLTGQCYALEVTLTNSGKNNANCLIVISGIEKQLKILSGTSENVLFKDLFPTSPDETGRSSPNLPYRVDCREDQT